MRHPVDVAAMFGSLWLLAAMVIDAATPPELTVYMIGAAIAPATVIAAVLYWLRVPRIDFAVSFATMWLITAMVLELITPKPLSPLAMFIAVAPSLIVGVAINVMLLRERSRSRQVGASQA
ncbi:hypothetical protein [Bradyrhizobium sp. 2TAF24]|uniref:hypothetical protein n=1 Tax=Bradyrhizobium sp. 2TAF24 TaxID=3233011 RepID=UPI003F8EDDA5